MTTVEPNWSMAVGDVNSKEMGTGARANGGKPRWELMPISQIARLVQYIDQADKFVPLANDEQMLTQIGGFQAGEVSAFDLLLMSVFYNWKKVEESLDREVSMLESLENVIKVWEFGLFKYAPFNWATGMNWSVCIACMVRHTKDHIEGRVTDAESKELHSAHVVCNAMMLLHFDTYWKQGDDRPLFAFPKQEQENTN